MDHITLALFGEAEKGQYKVPYFCQSLEQLVEYLGNPPANSQGIYFAVQALLYKRDVIFFRVKEEGFSLEDYLQGVRTLVNLPLITSLDAICAPGVGDLEIISAMTSVCLKNKGFLITGEADLYDYLTFAA